MRLIRAVCPLYCIECDPISGMIFVAGGGGSSKTGVPNTLYVCVWSTARKEVQVIHELDLGTAAIKNLATKVGRQTKIFET